ncbi:MAG: zf-HC2 domain-containing protein [Acidimicrobiales bacterium]
MSRLRRARVSPACREAARWAEAYLDGELPAEHWADLEDHLRRCVACGTHLELAARIRAALAHPSADGPEAPEALERLRAFARRLADGSGTGSGGSADPVR